MNSFGTCPRKREARQRSVIDPLRNAFGSKLPGSQQYWTLCGPMASQGHLLNGCELNHLLDEGLIAPGQFHGVEKVRPVFEANQRAIETAFPTGTGPKLFHGDFADVLKEFLKKGQLRPGLVNVDTMSEPRLAAVLLTQVLDILDHAPGQPLVIWNVILQRPRYGIRYTTSNLRESLESIALYRSLVDRWEAAPDAFEYDGTGTQKDVLMHTTIFKKRLRTRKVA